MVRSTFYRASAIAALAVLWNGAAAQEGNAPDYEAIVASPDRSDDDWC